MVHGIKPCVTYNKLLDSQQELDILPFLHSSHLKNPFEIIASILLVITTILELGADNTCTKV